MGLINLSTEQIIDRLKQENSWWSVGKIDEDYDQMQRRLYFDLFFPLVEDIKIRRAVILMGPRRVGKTVLIHHAIAKLMSNGVSPHKISYISIENPFFNNISLEQLFKNCLSATKQENPKGCYIFFDEIQYLKDWEVHLKSLVDSYPHTKFVVSGSAAAALKLKSTESGAGRFTDFSLPPLTFSEYIHLLKLNHLMVRTDFQWTRNEMQFYDTVNIALLNEHFLKYINYGGYPEIIFSERMQVNPSRFIKSDIIDKVLLRDLPSLYGIQDVQELNALFTSIAYNSGQEFSLELLSKSSGGVKKELLKKYIHYLEAAFLIKIVHRIDHHSKKFERANFFKLYLTNPSLRSALFTPLSPTDSLVGPMVETAIYAQWLQTIGFESWYARWTEGRFQGEVDMVGLSRHKFKPEWALEIKWSNRYFEHPEELKSLTMFCNNNKLTDSLITTIDKTGSKKIGKLNYQFVPASILAYTFGCKALQG